MSGAWADLATIATTPMPVTAALPASLEIPTRMPAGQVMPATPSTSTTLPAVWACVEVILNTALQVPLTARSGGLPVALPEWLRVPERYNGGTTGRQLLEHLIAGQALHGAGYAWAAPLGDSWVVDPVDPDRVAVELVNDQRRQRRVYRLDGTLVPVARRWTTRPSTGGLLVVNHRTLPGVAAGVGPIQAARFAVGSYLDTDAYAADVFGQGVPQGTLTTDAELTRDTAVRYRDDWMADSRQPVRVLGNGLAFTPFRLSPKDAAWLEARRYNGEEVARLFAVPAYKLNLVQSGGMVYSNAESLDGDFLRSCVYGGYLAPVESALSLLTPSGRTTTEDVALRFDLAALLRATTTERYAAYSQALGDGWLTVAEVREREGLPPLTAEVPA